MAQVETQLLVALLVRRFDMALAVAPAAVVPVEKFVLWAKDDIPIIFTERCVGV